MTAEEIKKAWNTFKKNIKKELPEAQYLGYTMSAKQIKNGTATILICNKIPYEDEIARTERSIIQVNGYETWTPEEKARNREYQEARIESYKRDLSRFGTKENELVSISNLIRESKAFKALSETIRVTSTTYDDMQNCYYLRINYAE